MGIQNRLSSWVGFVVFVIGLVGPTVRAADLPALKNADLGMRQGQRLSYLQASATVGASGLNLIPDANGRWVDVSSGRAFPEGAGSGGAGVAVFDVFEFGSQTIVKQSNYLINTAVNAITPAGGNVLVGTSSVVDILWAKPANFAATPNQNKPNFRVSRLKYTLDGRAFNAIRIQANTGSGWTQSTYDLNTGLLLIQSHAVNLGSGGTGLAFFRLTSGKRVTLPGIGTAWPAALKATKTWQWTASGTGTVIGAGSVGGKATVLWTAPQWSTFLLKINVLTNNKSQGSIRYIAGDIGSPWVSPTVLKSLRTNNVIDAESALQYRVVVGNIVSGNVAIYLRNNASYSAYVYQISTGNLIAVAAHTVEGLHVSDVTLNLLSRK